MRAPELSQEIDWAEEAAAAEKCGFERHSFDDAFSWRAGWNKVRMFAERAACEVSRSLHPAGLSSCGASPSPPIEESSGPLGVSAPGCASSA